MDIFKAQSIAHLLKNYIQNLPKKGRGEVGKISVALGVSPAFVSQVMSGEKCFTVEQAFLLSRYLNLNELQSDYLTILALKERSSNLELKKYWQTKLAQKRKESLNLSNFVAKDTELSVEDATIFYSNPLYSMIRLYTSSGNDGRSLNEICDRFRLTRGQVLKALDFLTKTQLCQIKNQRYHIGARRTHLDVKSPLRSRHHTNWRLQSINHIPNLKDEELMYSAVVSISKEDFDLLRSQMSEFIKQFLEQVQKSPAEDVACLNFDFFWV